MSYLNLYLNLFLLAHYIHYHINETIVSKTISVHQSIKHIINMALKGLVYGMSGILIPCLSDAALPEFMALCIRRITGFFPPGIFPSRYF